MHGAYIANTMMRTLPAAFLCCAATLSPAFAEDDPWIAYGKSLVEANCISCHAIDLDDESTHAEAPPFRILMERYPIDALEESFVGSIATGHPDMPEFLATPEQIAAIIDYIGSLELR